MTTQGTYFHLLCVPVPRGRALRALAAWCPALLHPAQRTAGRASPRADGAPCGL